MYSICKNSISKSIYPNYWKLGKVIPAFKKGIKSDAENYRPLTMLNLNSKILESIICDSLDKHLSETGILHPNQWGFKKGISTESLLLYLTETWKKAIDAGYKVGVIFVDFKKAFDTVDHRILESKLLATGISGNFHEWIVNYLSERSQYVSVNGVNSSIRFVEIGVPQGSLLGPRLYAIYANDLPEATVNGYIHMFADDTTIYYIGREVEEIIDMLNIILKDFEAWCNLNHLTVHTGKTEAMLISTQPFIGPMRPLLFGNNFISFTTKTTCLGVIIDQKLNWKPQIDKLHTKFAGKLKFLKKMKGLPTNILEEIYYKGIVPSITYCIAVWGTCPLSSFDILEKMHIKAAKLIHKIPSGTRDIDVLNIVKWKPLSYLYKRRIATIMYQIKNKSLPEQLTSLFESPKNTHNYSLRNKTDFHHIRYRNEQGRNSVRYRGPIVWNYIPEKIRSAATQDSFRRRLSGACRTLEKIQFEKEQCAVRTKDVDYLYF